MATAQHVQNDKEGEESTDEVRSECAVSDPKPVNIKKPLKLDYIPGVQRASFISQRSSSFESTESLLNNSDDETERTRLQPESNLGKNSGSESKDANNSGGGNDGDSLSESSAKNGSKAEEQGRHGGDRLMEQDSSNKADSSSHSWSFSDTLPTSMLNPAHQSTPVHYRSLSTVSEESVEVSVEHAAGEDSDLADKDIFMPGDLHTPILGFETMESRSRFTVFKIQVEKKGDLNSWFVFRRYSDFLYLNERLKQLCPGIRLSLPPKRWFRDNFDREFLEDRVLGLQTFLNNITGHKDLCNSAPVRDFLCVDDPPGPYDSLEESRALCDKLEESVHSLREQIHDKDTEISLLKEELDLYKKQVELLSTRLREMTADAKKGGRVVSPISTKNSLTECDRISPLSANASTSSNLRSQAAGDELQKDSAKDNKSAGSQEEKAS